jgi:hypothetical protein
VAQNKLVPRLFGFKKKKNPIEFMIPGTKNINMQLMTRGAFTHTHIMSQKQKKFHTQKGSHAPIANG